MFIKLVLQIGICLLLINGSASVALANEWQEQSARMLQEGLQPAVLSETEISNNPDSDLRQAVIRFYRLRRFEPAWMDRYGWLPESQEALAAIRRSVEQGLLAPDDRWSWLEGLQGRPLDTTIVEESEGIQSYLQLDLAMTEAVLRFAYSLTKGQVEPVIDYYVKAFETRTSRDLAAELATALIGDDLTWFLDQLGPRQVGYRALYQNLILYREIQAAGGWPAISEGPKLERGVCGPRVAELKIRLALAGDAVLVSEPQDDCFDEALDQAVQQFQRRHGLYADGLVGAKTLAALNVPVDQRIRQIELNLERWRWMPEDLGSVHVLVNIPDFQLKVVEQGRTVQIMRTIVGRQRRPTPMMSSRITYVEINPYWNVPTKIAREDLLPKIQEDIDFFIRQEFRVFESWAEDAPELNPLAVDWATFSRKYFPLRLRQEPTAHNALGRVKFMFPNEQSVYIHDTPVKNLFVKTSRIFSSGCVRVEKPLELLSYLLSRQNWEPQRLSNVLASGERQVVVLKEPIPVHLLYFTAWVEDNGEIQFREDIYGRDQLLLSALRQTQIAMHGFHFSPQNPTHFLQSAKNRLQDVSTEIQKIPL